jgi:hypothetical protein
MLVVALAATASMPPSGIRGDSGLEGVSIDSMADWMASARAEVPVATLFSSQPGLPLGIRASQLTLGPA